VDTRSAGVRVPFVVSFPATNGDET
jgi:hypothetical protein